VTEPGDLLGERFRVREVLAGGMGQIFICDWERGAEGHSAEPSEGAPVRIALKTFQRRFIFDNAARLSFVREASTWLRLSDLPHIMPVIDILEIGDQPFIMMPAIPRGDLGERSIGDLLQHGPIVPQGALAFGFQLALALQGASRRIQGLVHGDLKPANVLLWGGDAFLSDFGLVSAVALGRPDLRLQGTWGYRAPELWSDESVAPTVASDVYAFGALLFEMLVGRLPFDPVGDSREAWSTAHRESSPDVPSAHRAPELQTAAMSLALDCLAKDAGARPVDFAEVVDRIRAIYEQADPAGLLMLMLRAHELRSAMLHQAPDLRRFRIRSLLSLNEVEQALQELETIPAEEYDADLLVARGTALSLANRPGEALEPLARGLEGDLSPAERVGALSEYALALKRLRRFDEAQRIYEELMTTVADDQLPIVMVNLGTVYLEQGKADEAVQLLEPFVRKTPRLPVAWANLGQSYALVGRYDDAVAAFGKALLLAPQDGRVRVKLAAVYMDHLGDLEQAWTALDAAFDAGHESREWFVRMLASSLLLDKQETVQGMLWAAQNNMPADLGQSLVDESVEKARKLADKYTRDASPEAAVSHEPRTQPDGGGGDIPTPATGADAEDAPATTLPTDVSTEPDDDPVEPGVPFLNLRYYDFREFTIDYYQWPDAQDFVPALRRELRRAMRDPRLAVGGATLRGSAFYFTTCPACGITVLTNRTVGKRINCRMCGTDWRTAPVHGPLFDDIVADVSAELEIEQGEQTHGSTVYVLFVQPPDAAAGDLASEVCREAGMVELGTNRLMSIYMLREATARGLARPGRPWSVWAMTPSEPEAWSRHSTPRAISLVVGELQDRVPGVMTTSTTLTADQMASMDESIQEIEEEAARTLRLAVQSGEAQARDLRQLALLLASRGEHREAEGKARAAVAADESSAEGWEILGRVLFGQDDFAGARDALQESIARDPTSVLALLMLARCYDQLGDGQRAAELYARAISHSGGESSLS
jgi:serine/threonine protein kinase/predicted Zn-dependent protease